jgi:glutathione S-transferase
VLVTAIELGLDSQITLEVTNALRNADIVRKANPLGKIPCLIMADDELVVDSPVICQRLNRMAQVEDAGKRDLTMSAASSIDDVERIHALADGIMDAAVALVMESLRPAEQQSPMWQERWRQAVMKSIAYIETHEMQRLQDATLTFGHIALACALGYLEFRLPAMVWRTSNSQLANWYQAISIRPSLQQTMPKD